MEDTGLGVGLTFPLKVVNGTLYRTNNAELIESALAQMFGTALGERPILKDIASSIRRLLFLNIESNTATSLAGILINQAMAQFEDRAVLQSVSLLKSKEDPSSLQIRVDYLDLVTETSRTINLNVNQSGVTV